MDVVRQLKMTDQHTLKEIINTEKKRQSRTSEIRAATAAYPDLEIGEAYRKWKEERGQKPDILISSETQATQAAYQDITRELRQRPCTREGCTGIQELKAICAGCIEGQAGYKTKWTCKLCMHRDLSKKDMITWISELSSRV